MKCPFCEKENDCDCFVQVNKASLNEAIARAEKAESELKAIKDIWADRGYITRRKLYEQYKKTIEYLKQIGGVK